MDGGWLPGRRGGRAAGDPIRKTLTNPIDPLIAKRTDRALHDLRGDDGKTSSPDDACQFQAGPSKVAVRGVNNLINPR